MKTSLTKFQRTLLTVAIYNPRKLNLYIGSLHNPKIAINYLNKYIPRRTSCELETIGSVYNSVMTSRIGKNIYNKNYRKYHIESIADDNERARKNDISGRSISAELKLSIMNFKQLLLIQLSCDRLKQKAEQMQNGGTHIHIDFPARTAEKEEAKKELTKWLGFIEKRIFKHTGNYNTSPVTIGERAKISIHRGNKATIEFRMGNLDGFSHANIIKWMFVCNMFVTHIQRKSPFNKNIALEIMDL